MTNVSARLAKVISDSDLSYADLEKMTNIAKSSIQRYASGKTKKIPIDAVKTIAQATNSSAAWIMGWEDENPEQTKKEDAVSDIFIRLRKDDKFLDAVQRIYRLNDKQLDAVITMLSPFEEN